MKINNLLIIFLATCLFTWQNINDFDNVSYRDEWICVWEKIKPRYLDKRILMNLFLACVVQENWDVMSFSTINIFGGFSFTLMMFEGRYCYVGPWKGDLKSRSLIFMKFGGKNKIGNCYKKSIFRLFSHETW